MNKRIFFLSVLVIMLLTAMITNDKKVINRGFHNVNTSFIDSLNPEKSYRKRELIDNDGNVIESWEWNLKGKLLQHSVFTFNKEFETKKLYIGEDSIQLEEISIFDSRGRKIKFISKDYKRKKFEETITKYDKWGEKISELLIRNGKYQQLKSFNYNNTGLLISQINSDSTGKILSVKQISYSK